MIGSKHYGVRIKWRCNQPCECLEADRVVTRDVPTTNFDYIFYICMEKDLPFFIAITICVSTISQLNTTIS